MEPARTIGKCRIYAGDCRESLAALPAGSVHCCVTSPPYFGLRDYGEDGQIGLEKTPADFIAAMVDVFAAVRRVLRDDGTVWLNLGDSYSGGGGYCPTAPSSTTSKSGKHGATGAAMKSPGNVPGLKPKDLIGIPWRVALALQADGWYLRSEIIWAKPNPMPESVTDRPTKSHEQIFLLAKSPRYFYDAEAIKEKAAPARRVVSAGSSSYVQAIANGKKPSGNGKLGAVMETGDTKNKRDVWTVTSQPYKGAHFATYPPALIEPCILAGTSEEGVCVKCGAPWVRVVERPKAPREKYTNSAKPAEIVPCAGGGGMGQKLQDWYAENPTKTLGWRASCECGEPEKVPAVVLDPFLGSGTTAAVALKFGRAAIGCELNAEYIDLAAERIRPEAERFSLFEAAG